MSESVSNLVCQHVSNFARHTEMPVAWGFMGRFCVSRVTDTDHTKSPALQGFPCVNIPPLRGDVLLTHHPRGEASPVGGIISNPIVKVVFRAATQGRIAARAPILIGKKAANTSPPPTLYTANKRDNPLIGLCVFRPVKSVSPLWSGG